MTVNDISVCIHVEVLFDDSGSFLSQNGRLRKPDRYTGPFEIYRDLHRNIIKSTEAESPVTRNYGLRLGPLLLVCHTHSTLLPLLSLGSLINWYVRIWIWTIVLLDISFSALSSASTPTGNVRIASTHL